MLNKSLLQLHLAEYQALTTRNTYWITISYALWTIVLFYMTFVASIWDKYDNHNALIWFSGIVVQLICIAGYFTSCEQYNNILYMEQELRPMIKNIIGEYPFWGYEQYLAKQRGTRIQWWEVAVASGLLILLTITFCVFIKRGLSWKDYVGLISNIILAIFLGWLNFKMVRIRLNLFP